MEAILKEKPSIDSAAKNLLAFILGTATVIPGAEQVSQSDKLISQKILGSMLRQVNSTTAENVTGICATAIEHIQKEGTKLTKNSGRTMLQTLWPIISPAVVAECDSKGINSKVTEDVLQLMYSTFDNSPESPTADLSELVWAENFTAVLQKRQKQRGEEVRQRVNEAKQQKEQDEPRIVELPDED